MFAKLPDTIFEKLAFCTVTGCWWWGARWDSGNGYGKVRHHGKCHMAHRIVYALLIDEVPDDLVLDHKCRNRLCCNPEHLEPVTVKINTHRGEAVLFS